ncbi:hypothetical protein K488DRAFT_85200 [Vararia minispora EC-137]|uniref:Uncharacterized protein n=1 Tax=Vararia minispora EC-137 TaxID=1314806 RepID=A0ACB8QN67_9AGAM|nr:hypothetical protein K488DRAFT_85200 [Vararia minispora EC-137]
MDDTSRYHTRNGDDVPLTPLLPEQRLSNTDTMQSSISLDSTLQTGRPRRIGIISVLPALISSLVVGGLAAALLSWPFSRRVFPNAQSTSTPFSGAIVADERPQGNAGLLYLITSTTGRGAQSGTTLYVLIISSVAVHVVSFTTPFVLAVFGYWLAYLWVWNQGLENTRALPTPQQYGFLFGLCSQPGFLNVYATTRYLIIGRKNKVSAPAMLPLTLGGVVCFILINFALTLSDLWLHAASSTVPFNATSPFSASFLPSVGYKINTTMCPGPSDIVENTSDHSTDHYANCMSFEAGSLAPNAALSRPVEIDGTAVLLPLNLPLGVNNLTFPSFGIRSQCMPTTDCRTSLLSENASVCPSFVPPYNLSSDILITSQEAGTDASLNLRVAQFNLSTRAITFSGGDSNGYLFNSKLNPAGARVSFFPPPSAFPDTDPLSYLHSSTDFASQGIYGVLMPVVDNPNSGGDPLTFFIAECEVAVYDVLVSYNASNGTSSLGLSSTSLSDFNTTSTLLAALDPSYQNIFYPSLTDALLNSVSTLPVDAFIDILSRNLSATMLSMAAPLLESDKAKSGENVTPLSLSRYPLAPLFTMATLLTLYALLALTLSAAPLVLSASEVVPGEYDASVRRGAHATAVELAQRRLFEPMAVVADRFAVQYPSESTSSSDGRASAVKLEDIPDTMRVGVGFYSYPGVDNGDLEEDEGSSWRRRRRIFVLDAIQTTSKLEAR